MNNTLTKTAIMPPTHNAPSAAFPHGVRKGNILQVGGQVGYLPTNIAPPRTLAGPDLREQALQTLANVKAVLEEGGARWEDVMMLRIYLTDRAHSAEFNEIYNQYFADLQEPQAARATIYVGLPARLLIEIDALAVVG
ncbi:RidA family protein [Streptomyces sp. NPDC049597]|uniref:RidA family protein n=1 Tax=Streptomyces sp. NPDC049597 TaxID=3155276 RepID=UPI0034388CAF